jgi:thioredoxin reductase/intein/homing endonuclease
MAAAIYTCRKKLSTVILTVDVGGQNLLTESEENYPGYLETSGPKLMSYFQQQAVKFGAEFVFGKAVKLEKEGEFFKVTTGNGDTYKSKLIILAYGKVARELGVPGEKKFLGRGVHTCATCLVPGSEVVTNPSIKKIEKVEEGGLVFTAEGGFRKVVGKTERKYAGEVLDIRSKYFKEGSLSITPNHPVLVTKSYSGYGDRWFKSDWEAPAWIPAEMLSNNHALVYPVLRETKDTKSIRISDVLGLETDGKGMVRNKHEIYTSVGFKDVQKIDAGFCRMAGYFVSNGSITNSGINISFRSKDSECVRDFVSLMRKRFGVAPNVKKDGRVIRIEVYSKIVGAFFEELFGKYSYEKRLPMFFLKLPKEKQVEFIKGIWRGGGVTGKKNFVLVSNSAQLVSQVKIILLRLGIIPNISKGSVEQLKVGKDCVDGKKLDFKHDKFEIRVGGQFLTRMSKILGIRHAPLSKITRNNECTLHLGNFILLPIEKIEKKHYNGFVYNIAVEESNTYVTHNSILHNCDAPFMKGKTVAVAGGGNSALEATELLSKFATKVYLIHRRDEFRADPITVDKVKTLPNVEFILNTEIREIKGDKKVSSIVIEDKSGAKRELALDSVFIEIGYILDSSWLGGLVKTNEIGEVIVNERCETSHPGIFAAGDVTNSPYKQTVISAGMGATAGLSAYNYMRAKEGKVAIKQDWS